MTQYIADEAHFKEVIARVSKVKRSLWIGTADIKDLYVEALKSKEKQERAKS